MTTEIEKKFFKCFGIEKQEFAGCNWEGDCPYDISCKGCPHWEVYKVDYPKITAEKLLELICIYNHCCYYADDLLAPQKINSVHNQILEHLIHSQDQKECFNKSKIKQAVRKLFEEE